MPPEYWRKGLNSKGKRAGGPLCPAASWPLKVTEKLPSNRHLLAFMQRFGCTEATLPNMLIQKAQTALCRQVSRGRGALPSG